MHDYKPVRVLTQTNLTAGPLFSFSFPSQITSSSTRNFHHREPQGRRRRRHAHVTNATMCSHIDVMTRKQGEVKKKKRLSQWESFNKEAREIV